MKSRYFGSYTFILSFFLLMFTACKKRDSLNPITENNSTDSEKVITTFQFKADDNETSLKWDVYGAVGDDTIVVVFPYGSILDSLKPTITYKGKSINPQSSVKGNFNNPLTYTVRAEDNSTKNYIVLATVLSDTTITLDSSKSITSFSFRTLDNPNILNSDANGIIVKDTIRIVVPSGTQLKYLVPDISITGISILPANRRAQDFSSPVRYVVQAQNGTTKSYVVIASTPAVQSSGAMLYVSVGDDRYKYILQGHLYAIDATTGALKWSQPTTNFVSELTVSGDVIYMGDSTQFYAWNRKTGALKWKTPIGGVAYSVPAVEGNTVFVSSGVQMYAIDAVSGNVKWIFTDQAVDSSKYYGFDSPTIKDGVVYFGSANNYVYALEAATGKLKWQFLNSYGGEQSSLTSNACVENGTLYIGDYASNLLALDIADGKVKWVYKAANNIVSSPTVENGIVYFGVSNGGAVYALNAATGAKKWSQSLNSTSTGSPIVENRVLYINCDAANSGILYALDAETGTTIWANYDRVGFRASPVFFGGMVYTGNYAKITAFDGQTGLQKWQFATIGEHEYLKNSPCIADAQNNVFYPGTSGGRN